MGLKKKHFIVIIISSLVIVAVLFCTVVGYTLYLQWKKDASAVQYRSSIAKMTAKIFNKDVMLHRVTVKNEIHGHFAGRPVIQGTIINKSKRTVVSVLIEVSFADEGGAVLYRGWFYPLTENKAITSSILNSSDNRGKALMPGEDVSFKYLLKSCPKVVADNIEAKGSFAKNEGGKKITMDCAIAGIKVL